MISIITWNKYLLTQIYSMFLLSLLLSVLDKSLNFWFADEHYLKPLCPPAPAQKAAKYAAMQALLGTGGYRGENHTLKQLFGGLFWEVKSGHQTKKFWSSPISKVKSQRFPFCSTEGVMALLNVMTMNSYFQQQSGNKKVSTELSHFSVTVSSTNTATNYVVSFKKVFLC